jgi:hypothetical protein
MTTISVTSFKPEAPRQERRNLAPEYASECVNVDTSRGLIEPFRKASTIYTSLTSGIQTIYHYKFGDSTYWLTWPRVVDVAKSTVPQDTLGRIYFTGDGEPRMSTYTASISGGGPYPFQSFVLGVPSPKTAPTVAGSAGGTTVTRSYVYTFRTALGEESGPSGPTIASGNDAGTWTISGLDLAPPNTDAITLVAVASGVVTITANTFGLFAGEEVSISGTGVCDGVHRLASVGATSFTINLPGASGSATTGTWARVAAHNTTGMTRLIYRTTGTDATYRRSAAMEVTNPTATSFTDTVASTNLSIDLPEIEQNIPPKYGHSLVALDNNTLCCWDGSDLCFSEVDKPYSWPVRYRYTQPTKGVGLIAAGSGVIALTEDGVRYVSVPQPGSASFPDKIGTQVCVSKRGIVQFDGGGAFPATDGLYVVTPSSVMKATDAVFREQEWRAIQPSSLVAAFFDGAYVAAHQTESGGLRMLRFNLASRDGIEPLDVTPSALHVSKADGRLYLGSGASIQLWQSDTAGKLTGSWKSKLFQLSKPENMAVARLDAAFNDPFFSQSADDIAFNESITATAFASGGAMGCDAIGVVAVGASRIRPISDNSVPQVVFTMLNEAGEILFTKQVLDSSPFTLPAGFKYDTYVYAISANISVRGFKVATSMRELKRS